jgi:hypothetical protein
MSLLSACATATPVDPLERALYFDVLTLVRSKARDAWTIDRIAQDEISAGVMESACQVPEASRKGLLAWLEARKSSLETSLGGDARAVWLREGRDVDAISDLLELSRVQTAIANADQRAAEDCPFWLDANGEFIGLQGDADRFVIFLESRGQLGLTFRDDAVRLAGGGAGRLLLGGGIGERTTLVAGLELGGGGRFAEDGRIQGVLSGALPILLRFGDAGSAFDLEAAAVTYLQGGEGWPPGFRTAIAYGFITPRIGGAFAPHAMFWLGYEYHPARGRDEPFHIIGVGTRIGVSIDP